MRSQRLLKESLPVAVGARLTRAAHQAHLLQLLHGWQLNGGARLRAARPTRARPLQLGRAVAALRQVRAVGAELPALVVRPAAAALAARL